VKAPESDWTSVLKGLLTSPERVELVADVGELLQQRDLAGARKRLDAALDAGTLAILISDDIQDTELQRLLQAIARERHDTQLATGVPVGDIGADRRDGREPSDPVKKERARAEATLQELHAVQEQLAASRANEVRVGELERALEQEKGRTASAVKDLILVRQHLTAMEQNAERDADARDWHARELERSKAERAELAAKLTLAHEQLAAFRRSTQEAAELRSSLERERDAAKFAKEQIESLRRELVTRQTSSISSTEVVYSAVKECERVGGTSEQFEAVQERLTGLQKALAKMQDELNQEKDRSASAIHQLGAFQRETIALRVQAAGFATIQEELRQEKENTAVALGALETLKRRIVVPEAHEVFIPSALLFRATPVLLNPSTHTSLNGAKLNSGTGAEGNTSQRKDRRVLLPPRVKTEPKLTDGAPAQIRHRAPPPRSVQTSVRPSSSRPRLNEAASRDTIVRLKHSARIPDHENSAPVTFAPDLPAILRPDDGLWALY
jgi:hypothetical protein